MASATLRIRLLGELDLRLAEEALAPLGSGRAESLLAYLLLHRDAPQPRQRLAFLLWPTPASPRPAPTCGICCTSCGAAYPTPTGSWR
jgi:hypothetical protein